MARDPNNIARFEYNTLKKQVLAFQSIPDYDIEDYDLNNPKDFPKFIASVEKICRGSVEYRRWVNFLREHGDMNKCSFFENVTNIDSFKIKIHLHHEPVTLFDIVLAVYNKRCNFRELISDEMIAKEVLFIHYKMQVGVIPVSETIHELIHNQYQFVPSTVVCGLYGEFLENYREFIEPETIENVRKIEEISKTYDFESAKQLFMPSMVLVDTSAVFNQQSLSEVVTSLKGRVEELKNNNRSTE